MSWKKRNEKAGERGRLYILHAVVECLEEGRHFIGRVVQTNYLAAIKVHVVARFGWLGNLDHGLKDFTMTSQHTPVNTK